MKNHKKRVFKRVLARINYDLLISTGEACARYKITRQTLSAKPFTKYYKHGSEASTYYNREELDEYFNHK